MALSEEELQYFLTGIPAVFDKITTRSIAFDSIDTTLNAIDIIPRLDTLLRNRFVAVASAAGVKTPCSIFAVSGVDMARIQVLLGCSSPSPTLPNNHTNIVDTIVDLAGTIGNATGLNGTIIGALEGLVQSIGNHTCSCMDEINAINDSLSIINNTIGDTRSLNSNTIIEILDDLGQSVDNVLEILNIDNNTNIDEIIAINDKADAANSTAYEALNILGIPFFKIVGTANIVTSCTYNEKTYTLGPVITQGHATVLGILKAHHECHAWAKTTGDHYLTITGDTSGCSHLLDFGLAASTCIDSLGVNITYA